MNNYYEQETLFSPPSVTSDDEVLDMSSDFDFADYQVVRREFFAHIKEPAATFSDCKFYVNAACLSKFPNSDYAQVLVNTERKILAIRPCPEETKDSFPWCTTNSEKR